MRTCCYPVIILLLRLASCTFFDLGKNSIASIRFLQFYSTNLFFHGARQNPPFNYCPAKEEVDGIFPLSSHHHHLVISSHLVTRHSSFISHLSSLTITIQYYCTVFCAVYRLSNYKYIISLIWTINRSYASQFIDSKYYVQKYQKVV